MLKPINLTDPSISSFNFAKANYEGLSFYLLTLDWVQIFSSIIPMDVESLWLIFKQILFDTISTYVPIKQTHTKACVYPSFIRAALNKKLALWHN